jgi:hypothetical protein
MDGEGSERRDVHGVRAGTAVVSWFHRNPALSNQHCPYCGRHVGAGSTLASGKEHLIARRMGPAGGFSDPTAFNFHFRACDPCNSEKSGLEDHVAAVTLLTSPGREDAAVNAEAQRKAANSYDPRHKGKPVGEVVNEMSVQTGGMFTFGLISPAQLDRDKVKLLAFRHIQGLFALVTSEDPRAVETTRILPGDHFGFYGLYPHRDWGNPQLLEAARRAADIPPIAWVTTANGFFRAILRREDPPGAPWFWALEWNKSVRLTGWIGDPETPPPVFVDLPDPGWKVIPQPDGSITRYRLEVPLGDAEDELFIHAEDLGDPVTEPGA